MIRKLFLGALFLCFVAFVASAEVRDIEGRKVYCYVLNSPDYPYQYGLASFKTGESPVSLDWIRDWNDMSNLTGSQSLYAGAAANGYYYGFRYFFSSNSLETPKPVDFCRISLLTGDITTVKDWSDVGFKLQDMTFDYSTGRMYAVGFSMGTSSLYTIDINTGEYAVVANFTGLSMGSVAATMDGRLYGAGVDGWLYEINKETANLTKLMKITPDNTTLLYSQSMEFDHTDECLYWASSLSNSVDGIYTSDLYRIDIENKTIKSLGAMGSDLVQIYGLYIPYVKDGFDTPCAVKNMTVKPADAGKDGAVVSWTCPDETYGHEPLETGKAMSYQLMRDGEIVTQGIGVPGQKLSFNDTKVTQGVHIYKIVFANSVGTGEETEVETYVGVDVPEAVNTLAIAVGADCQSVRLEWDAPKKGAHGGYFSQEGLTYTITRHPDGKVIAENYDGTSFEDNSMKIVTAWYYTIVANNSAGESSPYTTWQKVVAGKPFGIPYSCTFDNENIVNNTWTSEDVNADGIAWTINSGWGFTIFKDYTIAAEFVFDDQVAPDGADDWLISPPIQFEDNKDYTLSFDARSYGANTFTVAVGNLNTASSQNTVVAQDVVIDHNNEFTTYEYLLPKMKGVNCIGIHLTTRPGNSMMFQFGNVSVVEGQPSGISNTVITEASPRVYVGDGKLSVSGDYKSADVYSVSGMRMGTLSGKGWLPVSGWKSGVYTVKIVSGGKCMSSKVVIK